MTWVLVAAGAVVGAPLRYLTDLLIQSRHDSVFPWGTLAVNVVGSFILGALVGVSDERARLLLGTGFSGALTTYSTFSYETLRLSEEGAGFLAVLNVAASVAAGLAAAALGVALASTLG